MRNIRCLDIHGVTVQEILDEFNQRRPDFDIPNDADIISISTRNATEPQKIAKLGGGWQESKVVVTLFYWSND